MGTNVTSVGDKYAQKHEAGSPGNCQETPNQAKTTTPLSTNNTTSFIFVLGNEPIIQ